MRRTLLAALTAASLVVPLAASASPRRDADSSDTTMTNTNIKRGSPSAGQQGNSTGVGEGSLGGAPMNGNEPGHVESPGVTKIDPETRAPLNDVQPGRGSNDTHQSGNPKPVR